MTLDGLVFPPGEPLKNAELFVTSEYFHAVRPTLVRQGGSFFAWDGTCWPEVEDAGLRAELYRFFGDAHYTNADGAFISFDPTSQKVSNLVDALRAHVHLPERVHAPAWLSTGERTPASELVACTNGLVHVPSRELRPLTPEFYVHHAVPFAYDPSAHEPQSWLRFLDQLWGDDPGVIDALQEVFGYLVSGDTSLQKIFLLVGPRRSGKGTIGRVLTAMMGAHHVAAPTLSSMATNFGLAPLIGKPLAVISDARLRTNDSIVTERLLSISGEDSLTIDRKYKDPWTGRLPTRFMILTNELPRLGDASGALPSRLFTLTMTVSFYGRENPRLTDELLTELPRIFNWSLDGLERLRERGYFALPASSADALRQLEDLSSPVGAFVRDCCAVGPGRSVPVEEIYAAWRAWCERQGRDRPGTQATFGRDLRAVVPGVKVTQPRVGEGRERHYEGIALRMDQIEDRLFQRVPETRTGVAARDGTGAPALRSSGPADEETEWMG